MCEYSLALEAKGLQSEDFEDKGFTIYRKSIVPDAKRDSRSDLNKQPPLTRSTAATYTKNPKLKEEDYIINSWNNSLGRHHSEQQLLDLAYRSESHQKLLTIDSSSNNNNSIADHNSKTSISALSLTKPIMFASHKEVIKETKKKVCCTCKKSNCLKLYCECFKKGRYCDKCSCPDCNNIPEKDDCRKIAIDFLKSKNKYAFQSCFTKGVEDTEKNERGCKCRNSNCLKNYCECYQHGISCAETCKCLNCYNTKSPKNNLRKPI